MTQFWRHCRNEFGYEGYWTPKHPIRDLVSVCYKSRNFRKFIKMTNYFKKGVIKSYEAKLMQTQFVILSNVELDNPKVCIDTMSLIKLVQLKRTCFHIDIDTIIDTTRVIDALQEIPIRSAERACLSILCIYRKFYFMEVLIRRT